MGGAVIGSLTAGHDRLDDPHATRRYFAKFARITGHLARVAATLQGEGRLSQIEANVLAGHVGALAASFRALSHKYLFALPGEGRSAGLEIDRGHSGFPVFSEFLLMASDAQQAPGHLGPETTPERLREAMLETILTEHRVPRRGQFAMAQRRYYEALAAGGLFWARNDPEALWLSETAEGRLVFLLHWAVYDSQINMPVIYLMEVEDSGRTALPRDPRRWPQVQAHLGAQALGGLKPVTIARGFDEDFDDLHPRRLRRLHLGPMYSAAFTRQTGPLRGILEAARADPGEDWALVWTEEDLRAERSERTRSGWFGSVERQVFTLDPFSGRGVDTGATRTERALILPERPFQVLAETRPAGFENVVKYAVAPSGRVLRHR